jgi:hypothetical protein
MQSMKDRQGVSGAFTSVDPCPVSSKLAQVNVDALPIQRLWLGVIEREEEPWTGSGSIQLRVPWHRALR